MSSITWDDLLGRRYRIGVSHGVLYPVGRPAQPWSGLVSVNEKPKSSASDAYYDGIKYRNRQSTDSFEGTIKAITFPDGFGERIFGFSYRIDTPTVEDPSAHEIHLVYNALAEPTEESFLSESPSQDLTAFEWSFSTKPIGVPGGSPTAHIVIDSTRAYPWVIELVENLLYGTDLADPRLPSPGELIALFEAEAMLRVIDNGDGTATFIGCTDDIVHMIDDIRAEISWSSVVYLDQYTCQISSF